MNINKNNYEAFFLDYHEGNLSPHQVADLLLFLEQHPELKEEFENFENILLEDISEVKFENKNNLKRNISDGLLISSIEGLLTKEENVLLDQQLSVDAKLWQEFVLYQKTILIPDTSVVFENKNGLKRGKRKFIPLYHYYIAAAASIVLLMGLFFIFENADSELKLADKKVESPKLKIQSLANEQPLIVENHKDEKNVIPPITYKVKSQKLKVKSSINEHSIVKEEKNISNFGQLSALAVNEDKKIEEQKSKVKDYIDNKNYEQPTTNPEQPLIAQTENKNETIGHAENLSLQEKTIDKPKWDTTKKPDEFKKLSGWDIAQVIAKGINRISRRQVEVKPTYNDEGDVTAYSITAGEFQLKRGR